MGEMYEFHLHLSRTGFQIFSEYFWTENMLLAENNGMWVNSQNWFFRLLITDPLLIFFSPFSHIVDKMYDSSSGIKITPNTGQGSLYKESFTGTHVANFVLQYAPV